MNDIGQTYALDLHTDSSARVGHCSLLGKGKRMKNRDGSELWIHQVLRQGLARINKIDGRANPVDILPKSHHKGQHNVTRCQLVDSVSSTTTDKESQRKTLISVLFGPLHVARQMRGKFKWEEKGYQEDDVLTTKNHDLNAVLKVLTF